ncbi:MAG: hypothetical protein K2I70_01980 [Bacilli bacterium]|nr:hypothetical protein [Bacilli bacterium]
MRKILIMIYIILGVGLFCMDVEANSVEQNSMDVFDMADSLADLVDNYNSVMNSDIELNSEWYDENGNMLPILAYKEQYIKTTIMYEEGGNPVVESSEEVSEDEYNDIEPYTWCGTGEICWETNLKKLHIIIMGTPGDSTFTNVRFAIVNTWKKLPKVRSYDNIGIIVAQYSVESFGKAYGYQRYNVSSAPDKKLNIKYEHLDSNIAYQASKNEYAVGISQNLMDSAYNYLQNELYLEAKLYDRRGTYAVASYQHAVKVISFETAMNFTFDTSGMGRVFKWNSSYSNWDNMQGVCLKDNVYNGDILWEC